MHDLSKYNYDVVLVHVGTNDLNKLNSEILTKFKNLISGIRLVKSDCKIILSSILPRPVDVDLTTEKIIIVNKELQKMCYEQNVEFLYTFSSYMKSGFPNRKLFAYRDGGLHLNQSGVKILKDRFAFSLS